MTKPVTEFDLRAEEFKDPSLNLDDLEFREDGKIVRKNRWREGIMGLVDLLPGMTTRDFEIEQVTDAVSCLVGIARAFAAHLNGMSAVYSTDSGETWNKADTWSEMSTYPVKDNKSVLWDAYEHADECGWTINDDV